MIWKYAGDFFKVLLIFKMAATDQLFGAQKLKKFDATQIQNGR